MIGGRPEKTQDLASFPSFDNRDRVSFCPSSSFLAGARAPDLSQNHTRRHRKIYAFIGGFGRVQDSLAAAL